MKSLLKLVFSLAASFGLVNCASYQQPENPTGASLDRPASGERSARETRYLEQEVVESQGNPAPDPINPMPPADPNATSPTDPAAIQAPMPPPTFDTPPPPQDAPTSNPVPPAPAPTASELPYGVPVPGKKGFVYSPYDKSAGFVDVRDISPGTKVRCPYTGKIFRVP